MTTTYYSDNYALAQNGTDYEGVASSPVRPGEPVFVRGKATIPITGRTAGDKVKIAPLGAGMRLVGGQVTASGANGAITVDIGYTSAATGIASASTAFQSAASTAFTPAQIAAAALTAEGDELILTLGGTVGSTATDFTVLAQFAKV